MHSSKHSLQGATVCSHAAHFAHALDSGTWQARPSEQAADATSSAAEVQKQWPCKLGVHWEDGGTKHGLQMLSRICKAADGANGSRGKPTAERMQQAVAEGQA